MESKVGWTVAIAVCFLVGLFYREVGLPGVTPIGISIEQRQFSVQGDPGVAVVMVDVPLVNRTSVRDRLVGMKSSCQCVTTANLPHEVLPGETWGLPLRIDSSAYSPGDAFLFELTLFLESGSAVPVQINFEMAERQPSHPIVSDEKDL